VKTERIAGALGLAAGIVVLGAVISSARAAVGLASWHWVVYPLGIVLACLGFWSLVTALWPWKAPAKQTLFLHALHPRFFFVQSWRDLHEEAFGAPEADAAWKGRKGRGRAKAEAAPAVDHRVIVVMLVVAFSLTLMEYFGDRGTLHRLWPEALRGSDGELNGFAYWALWRFLGYGVIPAVVAIVTPGMKLGECGISFKGFFEHLWIYVLLFLIVLATVTFVSYKPDFQSYYPFYSQTHRSWRDFLAWEGLYALQFVSLEFFFRGFMLHPLRRSLGPYAILAMIIPYCMIHYGKPYLEANAAIVAGVVLGTLSLRTGSIWCGALIHITVAVSMDVAALAQAGKLETLMPVFGPWLQHLLAR